MIAVLGRLADVERDLIRTRTAEGRSRSKARGQHVTCRDRTRRQDASSAFGMPTTDTMTAAKGAGLPGRFRPRLAEGCRPLDWCAAMPSQSTPIRHPTPWISHELIRGELLPVSRCCVRRSPRRSLPQHRHFLHPLALRIVGGEHVTDVVAALPGGRRRRVAGARRIV
jgi:hypothetical protein